MRAKYIFEKFKEDSDPINDLGIGNYYFDIEYYTVYDLQNELIKETNRYKIKFKIIKETDTYTTVRYIGPKNNLLNFIKNEWNNYIYAKEITNRIKHLSKSVNEKFKEHSDPIQDLNIGLPEFWKREFERMGSSFTDVEYNKYFPNDPINNNIVREKLVNLLYGTLKYIVINKLPQQRAFVKICVICNVNYNDPNQFKIRKMAADVLEKNFSIKVNPNFNLQEKFEQNSDPIEDLGIGMITFENIKTGDLIYCKKSNIKFIFPDGWPFPKDGLYIVHTVIKKSNEIKIGVVPYKFRNILDNPTPNEYKYLMRMINKVKTNDLNSYERTIFNTAPLSIWKKYFKPVQRQELKQMGQVS